MRRSLLSRRESRFACKWLPTATSDNQFMVCASSELRNFTTSGPVHFLSRQNTVEVTSVSAKLDTCKPRFN